jgi:hypothetical protein
VQDSQHGGVGISGMLLVRGAHEGMLKRLETWRHRINGFTEFSRLDGQLYQPSMVTNDPSHKLMALRIALPLYGRVQGLYPVDIHLHTPRFHRLDKKGIKATEGVLKDRMGFESTHIGQPVPFRLHRVDVSHEPMDIGDVGVDVTTDL